MNEKLQIFRTPIQELKEFRKYGETFRFVDYNEEQNTYLYERVDDDGKVVCYEVVSPSKAKNPDGGIIEVYPSENMFGYGRAICTRSRERAVNYLKNGVFRASVRP